MNAGSEEHIISIRSDGYRKQMESALSSRADLAFHHPVVARSVYIVTAPIVEMFRAVSRVVFLRETGCCFVGTPGIGKTCALQVVEAMLTARWPKLYVVRHDTHNRQIPSIRAFFKHFLATLKHHELKGETFDLRLRLVNWLLDEARSSGLGLVVLMIDEAQKMLLQDFEFLKDVYNDLSKEGVQLITILMAQEPQFSSVVKQLKHARRIDLVDRFTTRILPFRAYNSLEDLQEILGFIDSAVFPDNSETTWTEFYFPRAFANGFRMLQQSEILISALRKCAPISRARKISFPARRTFLAIKHFMVENAGYDADDLILPKNCWQASVKYAMVAEAMEDMNTSDREPNIQF